MTTIAMPIQPPEQKVAKLSRARSQRVVHVVPRDGNDGITFVTVHANGKINQDEINLDLDSFSRIVDVPSSDDDVLNQDYAIAIIPDSIMGGSHDTTLFFTVDAATGTSLDDSQRDSHLQKEEGSENVLTWENEYKSFELLIESRQEEVAHHFGNSEKHVENTYERAVEDGKYEMRTDYEVRSSEESPENLLFLLGQQDETSSLETKVDPYCDSDVCSIVTVKTDCSSPWSSELDDYMLKEGTGLEPLKPDTRIIGTERVYSSPTDEELLRQCIVSDDFRSDTFFGISDPHNLRGLGYQFGCDHINPLQGYNMEGYTLAPGQVREAQMFYMLGQEKYNSSHQTPTQNLPGKVKKFCKRLTQFRL